jgi:hypothetical protein
VDSKILAFLTSQIFTVPIVLACAVGVAIGLARRELGMRARLGMIGFGLLAASQLLSVLNMYQLYFVVDDVARYAPVAAKHGFLRLALELVGLVVLIVAVFHRSRQSAA